MKRYFKLLLILFLYTILVYHLIDYDAFPLSPNYKFPLRNILWAFLFSIPAVIAVEWYFQKVFQKYEKPKKAIKKFIITLVVASPIVFFVAYGMLSGSQWSTYYMLISFILSVLNLGCWIGLVYGKRLFSKWTLLEGTSYINIKSGNTIHKVDFEELSHFSSNNKVVVAHLISGKKIITNFNLSELENLLPGKFFRINRQYILSKNTIDEVRSIENQKLEVQLKEIEESASLIVSRYRASDFKRWLN